MAEEHINKLAGRAKRILMPSLYHTGAVFDFPRQTKVPQAPGLPKNKKGSETAPRLTGYEKNIDKILRK
jgi:hypothetical protein